MPSKEVFIPKNIKEQKGLDIVSILGNKPTTGQVGLEIEVEGTKLPTDDTPAPWVYHVDHSLRPPNKPGGMCAEYVLNKPIPFSGVSAALTKLWKQFKLCNSELVDSNRTSVHVHLNVQSFFLNRLTSFLALYFIVEEILTEWCGEHRVGNLFCLRAKDATAITSHLQEFIRHNGQYQIGEFMHYSAMNANALKKFGSLEVRTLRGCSDPGIIVDWVEILERLYMLSEEYPDPREVCTSLSSIGPLAFFESILGPKAIVVRNGIDMIDNQISNSVYEGVRIAQDLCFCRDWDLYKPIKIKPDIFGRKQSKIAKKLLNPSQEMQGFSGDPFPEMYSQGNPNGSVTMTIPLQDEPDEEEIYDDDEED